MILASRRGVPFLASSDGIFMPTRDGGFTALREVAEILGYEGPDHYNSACINRPYDVRARLAAL